MKKVLLLTLAFAILVSGLWAHEQKGKTEAATTPEVKLTGEVVCLSCYVDHEAKGSAHAACAASCAKRGVPLGILEEKTDKVYPVVKGHSGANETLQPFAGKKVNLTGKWFERGGLKVFSINTVAEAK